MGMSYMLRQIVQTPTDRKRLVELGLGLWKVIGTGRRKRREMVVDMGAVARRALDYLRRVATDPLDQKGITLPALIKGAFDYESPWFRHSCVTRVLARWGAVQPFARQQGGYVIAMKGPMPPDQTGEVRPDPQTGATQVMYYKFSTNMAEIGAYTTGHARKQFDASVEIRSERYKGLVKDLPEAAQYIYEDVEGMRRAVERLAQNVLPASIARLDSLTVTPSMADTTPTRSHARRQGTA